MLDKENQQFFRTAYHEAGHAIARLIFNIPFEHASIEPSEDIAGYVKSMWPGLESDDDFLTPGDVLKLEREIAVMFAGYYAEMLVFHDKKEALECARIDIEWANACAKTLAKHPPLSSEKKQHLQKGNVRAKFLVDQCEHMIALIALALLEAYQSGDKTVDQQRILAAVNGTLYQRRVK